MELKGVKSIPLSAVRLDDRYLQNAFSKEVRYLTSLDTSRLLAGFRETAGLSTGGVSRYGGWEDSLIGGHTLGHYMSACANACVNANISDCDRKLLLNIMLTVADGLKECQDAVGTGFIFGARLTDNGRIEQQFDNVENGRCNIFTEAWVPWYTMHKLLSGLVSFSLLKDAIPINDTSSDNDGSGSLLAHISSTSLDILSKLATWVSDRTTAWSRSIRETVLATEYGGMNDVLYQTYLLTGMEKHLNAAHAFDDVFLFENIYNAEPGDNALNGLHANTTIPKFIGALRRYMITGERSYLNYAAAFWDLVAENHTYITGDNSREEHFGSDSVLAGALGSTNCETCNAYNMLKLTGLLYTATGEARYADWYENTFVNTVIASQNPETGMTTYFQPMEAGYFKVFGTPDTKFWCCTGTGMENFTALQNNLFHIMDDLLVFNQYIASEVNYNGIGFRVCADLPADDTVRITFTKSFYGTVLLRLPYWLAGDAEITVDGEEYGYAVTGAEIMPGHTRSSSDPGFSARGYALISGPFEAGSSIELVLPMKVFAYKLPDSADICAFKYGPTVLAACTGSSEQLTGVTGVNVDVPAGNYFDPAILPSRSSAVGVKATSTDRFIRNISQYMLREDTGDTLTFRLTGTDSSLIFKPYNRCWCERYGIYFRFAEIEESAAEMAVPDGNNEVAASEAGSETEAPEDVSEVTVPEDVSEVTVPEAGSEAEAPEDFSSETDPGFAVRGGQLFFCRRRSTLLVKLDAGCDSAILLIPQGLKVEITSDCCRYTGFSGVSHAGRSCEFTDTPYGSSAAFTGTPSERNIVLKAGPDIFTGYSLRIASCAEPFASEIDCILMRCADDAEHADAFNPITGAFAGEACYIIGSDGASGETPSHGSGRNDVYDVDPVTGYRWGRCSNGDYCFELENGSYSLTAVLEGDNPALVIFPDEKKQRRLSSVSDSDELHAGIIADDGFLRFRTEGVNTRIASLTVRAIDTIAVPSEYCKSESDLTDSDFRPSVTGSITEDDLRAEGFIIPTCDDEKDDAKASRPQPKASATDAPRSRKAPHTAPGDVAPELCDLINSTLNSKALSNTAKGIGIVAGSVAIAGGIAAYLKNRRKK